MHENSVAQKEIIYCRLLGALNGCNTVVYKFALETVCISKIKHVITLLLDTAL